MQCLNLFLFSVVLLSVYANNVFGRTILNGRIVGGTVARPGQFPYQAGLVRANEDDSENSTTVFCGGAIIDNQWIITAGRCVHRRTADEIQVLVNSVNVVVDIDDLYNVDRIVVHPEFVAERLENDIALLRLDQPIQWEETILPIPLKARVIDGGTRSVVSGYGQITVSIY